MRGRARVPVAIHARFDRGGCLVCRSEHFAMGARGRGEGKEDRGRGRNMGEIWAGAKKRNVFPPLPLPFFFLLLLSLSFLFSLPARRCGVQCRQAEGATRTLPERMCGEDPDANCNIAHFMTFHFLAPHSSHVTACETSATEPQRQSRFGG